LLVCGLALQSGLEEPPFVCNHAGEVKKIDNHQKETKAASPEASQLI
jgi:hypothetical protein